MTLVVASVEDDCIWIVSDTALTDPKLGTRDRNYIQKIERSQDGFGIVAFAGDLVNGSRAARKASLSTDTQAALASLAEASRDGSADFLLARAADKKPRLWKVSEGAVKEINKTAHIGSEIGFNAFQKSRNGPAYRSPAKAVTKFMSVLAGDPPRPDLEKAPRGLSLAVRAMLLQFADQTDREVGGWPLAYVLTTDGAAFFSYSFSISDPTLDFAIPGDVISQGTPEAGGFDISVTQHIGGHGTAAYWVQRPGGCVMMRDDDWYVAKWIYGAPNSFKDQIRSEFNVEATLWVDERPAGPVRRLHVLHDKDGNPAMTVAQHDGRRLSFSVLNASSPFEAIPATIPTDLDEDKLMVNFGPNEYFATLSSDQTIASLASTSQGTPNIDSLNVDEIDRLLKQLQDIRSRMEPVVPFEVPPPPRTEYAVINPTWRTEMSPHQGLPGILLRLRHTGFGWTTFLLPPDEVINLSDWLNNAVQKPAAPTSDP